MLTRQKIIERDINNVLRNLPTISSRCSTRSSTLCQDECINMVTVSFLSKLKNLFVWNEAKASATMLRLRHDFKPSLMGFLSNEVTSWQILMGFWKMIWLIHPNIEVVSSQHACRFFSNEFPNSHLISSMPRKWEKELSYLWAMFYASVPVFQRCCSLLQKTFESIISQWNQLSDSFRTQTNMQY